MANKTQNAKNTTSDNGIRLVGWLTAETNLYAPDATVLINTSDFALVSVDSTGKAWDIYKSELTDETEPKPERVYADKRYTIKWGAMRANYDSAQSFLKNVMDDTAGLKSLGCVITLIGTDSSMIPEVSQKWAVKYDKAYYHVELTGAGFISVMLGKDKGKGRSYNSNDVSNPRVYMCNESESLKLLETLATMRKVTVESLREMHNGETRSEFNNNTRQAREPKDETDKTLKV